MITQSDLSVIVYPFEDLTSDASKEKAKAELIRIRKLLSSWTQADLSNIENETMKTLIQWHNVFLSTGDPYFTKEGRYFGNESYFSQFLYLVENASFRETYYTFTLKNYPLPDHFFKADTPSPPTVFPWSIVEMVLHKDFIATPPSPISESFHTFETADDLVHHIELLNGITSC
ncbi:MAG: hypothetical protein PHI40_03505 [Caldisericia bacterium]|nr:hypothetical protein [Caldisericia bacterium]